MVKQKPCTTLFGRAHGALIQAAIEEDTGAPCPCSTGGGCPLLGELQPLADARHCITERLATPGAVPQAHRDRRVS